MDNCILPDLSGEWLWKEDSISYENVESFNIIEKFDIYKIRFEPILTTPIPNFTNNKYKFYKMIYLTGPFADYPTLVIQYGTNNGIFVQIAESVDTGLSTLKILYKQGNRATKMEGIYQESGFIQDLFTLQKPKIGYSVFIRND